MISFILAIAASQLCPSFTIPSTSFNMRNIFSFGASSIASYIEISSAGIRCCQTRGGCCRLSFIWLLFFRIKRYDKKLSFNEIFKKKIEFSQFRLIRIINSLRQQRWRLLEIFLRVQFYNLMDNVTSKHNNPTQIFDRKQIMRCANVNTKTHVKT